MASYLCPCHWLWCVPVQGKWAGCYLAGLPTAQQRVMQLCCFGTQVFNFALGSWPVTTSSVCFLASGWGRNEPWFLYMQRTSNGTGAVAIFIPLTAVRILMGGTVCSPGTGRCKVWNSRWVLSLYSSCEGLQRFFSQLLKAWETSGYESIYVEVF